MSKHLKRLLALLLAVVMIVGMFPTVVFAADEAEPETRDLPEEATSEADDAVEVVTPEHEAELQADVLGDINSYFNRQHKRSVSSSDAIELKDFYDAAEDIKQIVLSSDTYVEDSLLENGDGFFWQTTTGITCGYFPQHEYEMAVMRANNANSDGTRNATASACTNYSSSQAGDDDVCVVGPMYAEDSSFTEQYGTEAKAIADELGGTAYKLINTNASITNIADAISKCRVVIFDSHGNTDWGYFGGGSDGEGEADCVTQANTSYLCLSTGSGITKADMTPITSPSGHYSDTDIGGYCHAYSDSYGNYVIDGTAIANHMTKDAPNSLLWMAICLGMATDGLAKPLHNKGVSVVYGYSQSVSFSGEYKYEADFWDRMIAGDTVAQAISYMKSQNGNWDPAYSNYSLSKARSNYVAFPIVVSDEDTYPGQRTSTTNYDGTVDAVQTVRSTWKLKKAAEPCTITLHVGTEDWKTINTTTGTSTAIPDYTAAPTDYTFVGWVESPISDTTATQPTYYNNGYTPSGNTDLYACFSTTTGGGGGGTTADPMTLSFSFTSCPSGWPSGSSGSANTKTYTVGGVAYTFSLGTNVYYNTGKYLMLKSTTYLGLPAIEGYKLTKVVATNSSGCSIKTKVSVTTNTTGTAVSGGTAQTWSKQSTNYTYNLSDTSANTMYYLRITDANSQIVNLELTYEPVSGGSGGGGGSTVYTTTPVECEHTYGNGVVTAPTCTAAGYTTHTCTKCGRSYTDTPVAARGHSFTGTPTAQDATSHYIACVNGCGEKNIEPHTFENDPAVCDACGYRRSTYTVSFSVPSGVAAIPAVTVGAGETVDLPKAGDVDGFTFSGWVTGAITNEVTSVSTRVQTPYTPTASITLYALYSRTVGSTGTGAWTLLTNASDLTSGMKVVFASNANGVTAGDIASAIMGTEESVFASGYGTITSLGSGTVQLTVGGSSGAWTFANASGDLLGATAVKKLAWGEGTTTWSVSVSDGDATIQNATDANGKFLYNVNSPRFTTYTSDASATMVLPQIYYMAGSAGTTMYTTSPTPPCTHPNKQTTAAVAATCTTAGNLEYFFCPACGKYFKVVDGVATQINSAADAAIEELGHDFSGAVTKIAGNDNQHSVQCTRCTETSTAPHTFGTATIEGLNKTETCTACGYVKHSTLTGYTVSYSVLGRVAKTETVAQGSSVTLPKTSDANAIVDQTVTNDSKTYTFAGWVTSAIDPENTTAPTILTGTYTPTADVTLYAVYTRVEEGQGGDPLPNKNLTFGLTDNPGGWPTTNPTTLTNYTYKLDGTDYTFGLKNVKCNTGYLMLTKTAVLGLPAIEGYKLTKVVAKNSSGCSKSTNVAVTSNATGTAVTGGSAQTWTSTSSTYTYNLSNTAGNTVYYLYVTSANAQIINLALTYEPVDGGTTGGDDITYYTTQPVPAVQCDHANTHIEGATAATCTSAGFTGNEVCDDCGTTVTPGTSIAALGHEYGAFTSNDNGTHTKECSVCHDKITEDCSFVNTTSGTTVTHTCSVCSYSYTSELNTFDITYSVPAGVSAIAKATVIEGNSATLPTAGAVDGYTFAGWVKDAINDETATAPTVLTGSYTPTADVTLHALYTRTEGGSGGGSSNEYTKVTSAPTDWSGDYLIVYEAEEGTGYVFNGLDAGRDYVEAGIVDNKITLADGMASVTIDAVSGGYSLMVNGGTNNGKYMYGTSGSNGLNFGDDASANTISFENGEAEITCDNTILRFNSTAGDSNMRFRYYKSTTTGANYHLVSLYKAGTGSSSTTYYTTNPEVEIECDHANAYDVAEQSATCQAIGYTAGRYCPDCEQWISGHMEIAKTSHTYGDFAHDADSDPSTHTQECSVCHDRITEPCSFTDTTVGTTVTHTCSVCHYAYETQLSEYTVTYSVPTGTAPDAETVIEGNPVTLPTAGAVEGYTFAGWVDDAINDETTTAPTVLTGSYTPTATVTLHALYTRTEEGQGAAGYTLTDAAPVSGDQIIFAVKDSNGNYVVFDTYCSADNEVTVSGGTITSSTEALVWTVAADSHGSTSGLSVSPSSGSYLHFNSSAIKTATDKNNGIFEFISNGDGTFKMHGKVNDRYLKYASGFAVSDKEADAAPVYIFKYSEGSSDVTYYTTAPVIPEYDIIVDDTGFDGLLYFGDELDEGSFAAGTEIDLHYELDTELYAFDGYILTNADTEQNVTEGYIHGNTLTMPAFDVILSAQSHSTVTPTYGLNIAANPTDGGSVAGVADDKPTANGAMLEEGTEVILTATANPHYTFQNWTLSGIDEEDCIIDEKENSVKFVMPAGEVSVTANFELIPTYALNFSANPAEGGTVAAEDNNGTVNTGAMLEKDTIVTLTATPAEHYTFNSWTVTGTNDYDDDGNVIMVTMTAGVTVTANFDPEPTYTVTVTPAAGGTMTASKTEDIYAGEKITLTATPDEHYHFNGWQVTAGGASVSNNSFTMPAANVTVTGSFTEDSKATVTYSVPAGVTPISSVNDYVGTQITLPAGLADQNGYTFAGWVTAPTDGDTTTAPAILKGSYKIPAADITLYAVYKRTEAGEGGSSGIVNSISVGDKVVIICESKGKELTAISTTSTKYGIGSDFEGEPDGIFVLEVVEGSQPGTYAFKNGDNYLGWSSGNSLKWSDTKVTDNSSWTVSIDSNGDATVINCVQDSGEDRVLWWNNTSGSERFACYTGKEAGNTYIRPQFYNMDGASTNYYNTNPVRIVPTLTAENDLVIFDRGRTVTIDVLANDTIAYGTAPAGTVTVADVEVSVVGSLPAGVVYNNDGTFTFISSGTQTQATFSYKLVDKLDPENESNEATVTLKPNETVYYDETDEGSDFFTFTDSTGSGNVWAPVTDERVAGLSEAEIFELDQTDFLMYSGGSAQKITVTKDDTVKTSGSVSFTFAGTGFEIISAMTNNSGAAKLTITDEDEKVVGKPIYVDTYRGYSYNEEQITRYNLKKVTRYALFDDKYVAFTGEGDITEYTYYYDSDDKTYVEPKNWYNVSEGETVNPADNPDAFVDYINADGSYVLISKQTPWVPVTDDKQDSANNYQIPVMRWMASAYGTYTVTLQPIYSLIFDRARDGSYDFIFDGVNIYGQAGGNDYRYIDLNTAVRNGGFGSVDVGGGDAHEHSYTWKHDAATEGAASTHTGTCSCGDTVNNQACSFKVQGTTYTCSVCGYSYTVQSGFTATFHVPEGATAPEALTGASVTMPAAVALPSEYDAHEYTFAGWVKGVVSDTETAQTVYTAGTSVTLDADTGFYALYTYGGASGYKLSSTAPVAGDSVIIAVEVSGTYYALPQDSFTGEALTVSGNTATNVDGLTWTAYDATYSGSTGIGFNNGTNPLHINNSALKIASGDQNATLVFTASGDGFIVYSNQNTRWLKYNGNSFNVATDESNAATIYFFKNSAGSTHYTTEPGKICHHTSVSLVTDTAATCTETGIGHTECDNCGETVETGIVLDALGHNYEITSDPSELNTTYTCSRCHDSYTEYYAFAVTYALQPGVEVSGGSRGEDANVNQITLPNAASIPATYDAQTYTFVGWATESGEDSSTQPTLCTSTVTISADTTFYPVYSFGSGSGSGGNYEKVTSTTDLANGKYLIVYEGGSVALNGALKADAAANTVTVTINNGKIASTTAVDAAAVTIDTSNGSILGGGGMYIGHSGTSNTLNYSDSALTNTITFDSGNVVFTQDSYTMRYNKTADQARFRYYKSGQEAIQLYKLAAGTPATTTYTFELQQKAPHYSAAITPTRLSLTFEATATLTATLLNNGEPVAAESVEFSSSNGSIVMVDEDTGYLVAGSTAGNATITVEMLAADGEIYEATCTVYVSEQSNNITVNYIGSETGKVYNWGTRGTVATFLTAPTTGYYTGSYSYETLAAMSGDSGTGTDFYGSELGDAIHRMLVAKQTTQTTYDGTKNLYAYTDCIESDTAHTSGYYTGKTLSSTWDSGSTWNREHVWPSSKCINTNHGADGADIMMLRPESANDNSGRGNTAFGESSGYYNPDAKYPDKAAAVRGDVARNVLYTLMRWGNTTKFYGTNGVIENRDILIKWMNEDPVDTWELARNDAAQRITGVRNIFVDYPELAYKLLGAEMPENYSTPSKLGIVAKATYSATRPSNYEPVTEGASTKSAAPAEKSATRSGMSGIIDGAVMIDGKGTITSEEDFNEYGPDFGVYLAPGQALVFKLSGTKPSDLAIGAKALNGTPTTLAVAAVTGSDAEPLLSYLLEDRAIASAAEQYYDLDLSNLNWPEGGSSDVIIIYNASENGVLDVTNLRYPTADSEIELVINTTNDAPKAAKAIRAVYGVPETDPTPITPDPADTEVKFDSASLTLNSDIAINFYVASEVFDSLSDPYVVFTKDGADRTVDVADETEFGYCFRFDGINPAEMGKTVTATLYGTRDGELVSSAAREYSVLTYVNNTYAKKADDSKLCKLLADLVIYGAAAQQYIGSTETPVTELVSADLLACATAEAPELNNCTEFIRNENAAVFFKSVGLSLRDKVTVRYTMNLSGCEDVSALELRVTYEDLDGETRTAIIPGSSFTENNGSYVASFSDLNAAQMRTVLSAGIYSGDTCISETLLYSIESYANAKASGSDALAELVNAMMKYGDAANAFYFAE